ncbi:MAG: Ldh family oxidoreductase [Deltaproteobacteria bacterium]|nr:Ldh family oxidoreductase [Deltaproteobacteria bacterium]
MKSIVNAGDLRTFVEQVYQTVGASKEYAQISAEVMVEANLCGVDSHGVRMLPGFVTLVRNGKIKPQARIQVIRETPVIAHLDANLAPGHVVSVQSMKMAVKKAKTSGIGFVLVRNSTHWGRAAYYSVLAAREGCAGICFVNTESNMPYWGTRAPRIGNNPLSIGVPRASGEPVVLDMAMSQAAFFKIVLYNREGKKVPLGWGVDEQGRPTDDPAAILKSKRLVPTGQHKGSGLALMTDILTGILSGGMFCGELLGEAKGMPHSTGYAQAFMAIDIAFFLSLEAFQRRVDELVAYVKGGPPAEGLSEIHIPGERSWRERALREKVGIPLDEITLGELRTLADQLGIPCFPLSEK